MDGSLFAILMINKSFHIVVEEKLIFQILPLLMRYAKQVIVLKICGLLRLVHQKVSTLLRSINKAHKNTLLNR